MSKFLPSCYRQGRGQGHTLCSKNPLFPTNHVAREKTHTFDPESSPCFGRQAGTIQYGQQECSCRRKLTAAHIRHTVYIYINMHYITVSDQGPGFCPAMALLEVCEVRRQVLVTFNADQNARKIVSWMIWRTGWDGKLVSPLKDMSYEYYSNT